MTDGNIAVKFGSLAAGEDALATGVSQLQAKLHDLENQLQPLVRSWSGDAQAAYLAQKAKWEEAAGDMASMLQTIQRALGDAHSNYKGADNAVANSWS